MRRVTEDEFINTISLWRYTASEQIMFERKEALVFRAAEPQGTPTGRTAAESYENMFPTLGFITYEGTILKLKREWYLMPIVDEEDTSTASS